MATEVRVKTKVRQVRESAGMPQWKLAELVGVTQSRLCDYEYNRVTPPIGRICDIARHLKVDPAELIDGVDMEHFSAVASTYD